MSDELPTIPEIVAVQDLLRAEGIWDPYDSIAIYIRDGLPRYLGKFEHGEQASGDSLEELLKEERRLAEKRSPYKLLKREAAKLGFELVKKGGQA